MKTLYFSSNRLGSMGGYDIFLSKRLSEDWNEWSDPLPLIDPINSIADDIQPYLNAYTGYLYFSSRRDGSSDIYRIKISEPKPPKITILGKIIDSKTLRPVESSIYLGKAGEDNYQKLIPSHDGEFTAVVDRKEMLKLFPYKDKYVSRIEIINVDSLETYDNVSQLNIYIDQKAVNSRISLNPIYFLQSKPIILEKSYVELRRLVTLLKDNPNVFIRIEGHTDNQGNPDELLKLSEDRALAVKDFLQKEGIDAKRLEIQGYGAKRPITKNATLQQRELNRRVEFIITKIL
jgi:outer membrane protein OmpA-like peptidoglycan-associated protein